MHRPLYKILLMVTILLTAGGIVALLPREAASYPNLLGYFSFCTFQPAASLFCFVVAGSVCFFRSTFVKDTKGTRRERFQAHAHSLIPLAVVLVLAFGSTFWFFNIKSGYTDTTTQATVQQD